MLRAIADISAGSGVRVANVFHAGDGNLHPLVLFDDAVEGAGDAAEKVSGAILDLCIEHGGSITGEHGVGMDKAKYMPRMYTDDDLDTMQLVRCAFDPQRTSPTRARCSRPPGSVVTCPDERRPPTPCRTPGSRRSSDEHRHIATAARVRPSPPPTPVHDGGDGRHRRRPGGLVARPADIDQVAEVMRAAAPTA